MSSIRILLADLPHLLIDIVCDAVADEPDMQVVGVVPAGGHVAFEAERTRATLVIVGTDPHGARTALIAGGRGVLSVTANAHAAVLEVPLGEVSPVGLVRAIREVPVLRAVNGEDVPWP